MGNLISVVFPTGTGIQGLVFWLLKSVYNILGNYGLAIVFFTLVLKVIMLPLDFFNKYFTKKNSLQMAEFKPEEERLKSIYAGDPVALNREKQALYKKYGYSQGGFCLVSLVNIVLMLVIFINVFNGLRAVSDFNLNEQFKELQAVYEVYEDQNMLESEEFAKAINKEYEKTTIKFLWVKNIWRPDGWNSQTLTFKEFKKATSNVKGTVFKNEQGVKDVDESELRKQYETIFKPIKSEHSGWNGLFLLVVLAGVTTYFSTLLSNKIMAKKKSANPVSQEAGYSIRSAKEASSSDIPQIDPQAINNIMKFVLPVVMVIFTFSSTAALALYIISSSVISTLFTLGINLAVDKIIKAKTERTKKLEPTTINPHAKYFKKR